MMPLHFLTIGLLMLVVSGCSTMRGDLAAYDRHLRDGQFDKALDLAEARRHDKNRNQLLWALQAGVAARHDGNFDASNHAFDLAEQLIREYNLQSTALSAGQTLASLLINDRIRTYTPKEYEGIMVNTYKAFNYMALQRSAEARVEFNRAVDRQRRAKERFQASINKQRQAIALRHQQEQRRQGREGIDVKRSLDPDHLTSLTARHYSNFDQFGVYPDFINPFTTYSAGLFFALSGDHSKAASLLKEAAAMVPDNRFIQADHIQAEKTLNKGAAMPSGLWVFFENGRGAHLEEIRLDLPLFVATNRLIYTGIALPKLSRGREATKAITVLAGAEQERTRLIASMDRVVQTEFKEMYWTIVTKAMLAAMTKTTLQYQARKELGEAGMLLTALFQVASTSADLRSWTGLPTDFQIARLGMPANRRVSLLIPGRKALEITLPVCTHAILYVTLTERTTRPAVQIIPFGTSPPGVTP